MAPDQRSLDESVINPAHYQKQNGTETIDYIVECCRDIPGDEAVFVGNAIKYISRYREKNPERPQEDIEKAQWYLNRLRNLLVAKAARKSADDFQLSLFIQNEFAEEDQ